MGLINWLKGLFAKHDEVPAPKAVEVSLPLGAKPLRAVANNESAFFDIVRAKYGTLSDSQVAGFREVIAKWDASGLTDLRWLSYMLATAWHETWFKMTPTKEMGGENYLRAKPYYPYYGRGYVQLTWKVNYERYGIAANPEQALDPDMAAHVMIDGMTAGIFTGKSLKNYFNGAKADPINARRIINGLDKAQEIAGHYAVFYKACTALKNVSRLSLT